jgi:signal transduction histidine kinase
MPTEICWGWTSVLKPMVRPSGPRMGCRVTPKKISSVATVMEPRQAELLEMLKRFDGMVEVEVSDTGPGISDEISAQLFRPFVTTKAGGMGVGLSISKRIIESHGGEISVRKNGSGGASFRFTLPAIEDE